MLLETPRLRLGALHNDDAATLYAYRGSPAVSRYQGWRPSSVDQAREFIARQAGASLDIPDSWSQFAIRLRTDGCLIGDLGVYMPEDGDGSVEFGISIAPDFQAQRYAAEVLRALFKQLFVQRGMRRIHASVDPRNLASMTMLRSVGMRQEAHHLESLRLHGEWVDDVVFALLAREWLAMQSGHPSGAVSR